MSPIVTLMRSPPALARSPVGYGGGHLDSGHRHAAAASGRATRPVPMANSSAVPFPASSAN